MTTSKEVFALRKEGALDELPATIQSAANFKDKLLITGGLKQESSLLVKGGGAHARSAGTFLTCVPFKHTNGADVYAETSMDQIAARELAKDTQIASLELGIEPNSMLGSGGGSPCAYIHGVRLV